MVGGLRATRGSSSRLGREAATALVEVQREGNDIGITPDGPRGPCYDFKPGAVIVPRRTGAPLLLVGGEFDPAWRMRSWDRFYLPVPFSRVRMRCDARARTASSRIAMPPWRGSKPPCSSSIPTATESRRVAG